MINLESILKHFWKLGKMYHIFKRLQLNIKRQGCSVATNPLTSVKHVTLQGSDKIWWAFQEGHLGQTKHLLKISEIQSGM